jgi:hypothetical protein
VELEALNRRRISDVQGMDAYDISKSLQAPSRRSNGSASIVIQAEGFQPSNEGSFTD